MNNKKSNFIERPKVTIRRKTISAPANSAKWRIALRVANTKLFEEIILRARMKAVSYTHLTLPTIRLV